nr:MAG TPA: hypothetical protein [Caudoviricetes sp.]
MSVLAGTTPVFKKAFLVHMHEVNRCTGYDKP